MHIEFPHHAESSLQPASLARQSASEIDHHKGADLGDGSSYHRLLYGIDEVAIGVGLLKNGDRFA